MLLLTFALVLLAVFAVRVKRDSSRWGNGVFLLLGGFFLVLGLTTTNTLGPEGTLLPIAVLLSPLLVLLLAGMLIANGFVVLRREGVSLSNVLPLFAGLAIVGNIVALIVSAFAGEVVFLAVTASSALAVGYLGLLFSSFVAYLAFHSLWSRGTGHEAIITLGAGLDGTAVTPLLAGRLDRALTAHQAEKAAGNDPLLITSGGQGPGEAVAEAVAMAEYLEHRGAPPDRIRRETLSTNTEENLLFTKRILDEEGCEGTVLVVTSNYHTLRAAALAKRAGIAAHTAGSRTAGYFLPSAVLREFAAVMAERTVTHSAVVLLLAAAPTALLLAF